MVRLSNLCHRNFDPRQGHGRGIAQHREDPMASFTPTAPAGGAKITLSGGKLQVPNNPIIPFIEGDGTGPDIWRASVRVLDAAVAKAYGGKRKIHWLEIYAGEKANNTFGDWQIGRASCRERVCQYV